MSTVSELSARFRARSGIAPNQSMKPTDPVPEVIPAFLL
jgi:hypothetical protein